MKRREILWSIRCEIVNGASYGLGVTGYGLVKVEKRFTDEGLRDLPTGR